MSGTLLGCNDARQALAEIRAYPKGLQAFVLGAFDELEGLTERLLARELSCQQARRQSDTDALHEQIDRLASLAADLTNVVAEQKKVTGQRNP